MVTKDTLASCTRNLQLSLCTTQEPVRQKDVDWFLPLKQWIGMIAGSLQSYASSPSSSSSSPSCVGSSILSRLKARSVFPELMSRTCKLDRCAKVVSSVEPTASWLNLKVTKSDCYPCWKTPAYYSIISLIFFLFAFTEGRCP